MKITDLQLQVLRAMREKPITGIDLKRACGYPHGDRAFACCIGRMLDKKLIDLASLSPPSLVMTETGRAALSRAYAE